VITEDKPLIAIDINLPVAASKGTAYYRIDPQVRDFMRKCMEKHEVIGFEWDGSLNFGIILGEKHG